jgi:hypothetical protein
MSKESGASAKSAVLYTFIGLCFVFLLVLLVNNTGQLTNTRQELYSTQNELTGTQTDLVVTQIKLETKDTELSQAQSDLAWTQAALSVSQKDLETTTTDLQATSLKLETVQKEYQTAADELTKQQEDTRAIGENYDNLMANYNLITSGYGYVLKDPTYQQMKAFLAADRTDANDYVEHNYVCEDFSVDVKAHAIQQKYRCAYVSIRFVGDNSAHAIVAFNTTDRGLIFIEPQSDEEVNLQIGWDYWTECVIANPNTYYNDPTDYNDTIWRYNIVW